MQKDLMNIQKKFIVIAHPNKRHAQTAVDEITRYISQKGHEVVSEDASADIAIVLGGDGFMMHNIDRFAPRGIACFGINAGDVGFITHGIVEEWKVSIDELLAANYCIEERMMIDVDRNGERFGPFSNDVFLRHPTSVAEIMLRKNNEIVYTTNADGIVVATPMGSTAYNASVGGPIIEPGVHALSVAPISPLEFNAKPMILKPDSAVAVHIVRSKDDAPLAVVADGAHLCDIQVGEEIIIRRSDVVSKFIVCDAHGFFRALQSKKGLKK